MFTENLNGNKLCAIYNTSLLKSARDVFGTQNSDWILQEDNDPKHYSHVAQQWKKDNGVTQLEWPSQSPDVNPLENAWAVLKANVASHNPKNRKSLVRHIKSEWKKLTPAYAQALVNSMKRCIETVIKAKGDNTPY